MGLSIVVSAGIIFTILMIVLFNVPGFLGSIFSVEETSSKVSKVENSISQTNIFIDSLAAISGSSKVNFTLNNDGNQILWDYENFDIFVTYDSPSGQLTNLLTYSGFCLGSVPSAGNWCIEEIEWDLDNPGVLNKGEGAMIRTQLNQNLATGIIIIDVSTNNGVGTSLSSTT